MSNGSNELTKPTVHLNGTSRAALVAGYRDALRALHVAKEALEKAAPNARDYYPQGQEMIQKAGAEHYARVQKIHQIMEEIAQLREHVSDDGT